MAKSSMKTQYFAETLRTARMGAPAMGWKRWSTALRDGEMAAEQKKGQHISDVHGFQESEAQANF